MSKLRSALLLVLVAAPSSLLSAADIHPPDDPEAIVARVGDRVIRSAEVDRAAADQLALARAKRLLAEIAFHRAVEQARDEGLKALTQGKVDQQAADPAGETAAPAVERVPQRFRIEAPEAPSLGPERAPVTLVVFSDFECPFSAQLAPKLAEVVAQYRDQVRLLYLHFPLAMPGQNAFRAAEIAFCAGEQGKFWQVHDLFFREQQRLTEAGADELSRELELDRDRLKECQDSGRAREAVLRQQQEAAAGHILGTPTLFVNGLEMRGSGALAKVAQAVEAELIRLSAKP